MSTRITDGGELAARWYQQVELVGRYEARRVKRPGGGGGAIALAQIQ